MRDIIIDLLACGLIVDAKLVADGHSPSHIIPQATTLAKLCDVPLVGWVDYLIQQHGTPSKPAVTVQELLVCDDVGLEIAPAPCKVPVQVLFALATTRIDYHFQSELGCVAAELGEDGTAQLLANVFYADRVMQKANLLRGLLGVVRATEVAAHKRLVPNIGVVQLPSSAKKRTRATHKHVPKLALNPSAPKLSLEL